MSHFQLKPLEEQVVVVFGASSGIGRATALSFAARGAKVVAAARGEAGLKSLVSEIESAGGTAIYALADTTDFEQVERVAERAVEHFGRIDTWVHLASVSIYATFEQTTPEEFRRVVDVNLVGQAFGAMAALPHLRRAGGGALIHVSSVESLCALPLQSAYTSSKHGMRGFIQALRLELARDKVPISVTNVMPAGINTPLFNHARTKLGVKPMPIPPVYEPSVAANVILHAAQVPTGDIVAGGASNVFLVTQRISQRALDAVLLRIGFEGQKTPEKKSAQAPANLYEPIDEAGRVEGDFGTIARGKSLSNWFETHPTQKQAFKVGALGLAAWLLLRRRNV
ncbi:MAG TPA: SDR family oxidoreductase [Abditibacteriaceae bacterium]|jgi:NAD(P)-dependent dehydrogenase (short-subunit alcohol dehydrogenase family)